jgi:hypothetical protein
VLLIPRPEINHASIVIFEYPREKVRNIR